MAIPVKNKNNGYLVFQIHCTIAIAPQKTKTMYKYCLVHVTIFIDFFKGMAIRGRWVGPLEIGGLKL